MWRRSWGRIRGTPARAHRRRNRAAMLCTSIGVPVALAHTRPRSAHCSPSDKRRSTCAIRWVRRDATREGGKSMVRVPARLFGAPLKAVLETLARARQTASAPRSRSRSHHCKPSTSDGLIPVPSASDQYGMHMSAAAVVKKARASAAVHACPCRGWWAGEVTRSAERSRRLAVLTRIGAVAVAVSRGELDPTDDSRRAYQCMAWHRGANAARHTDSALYQLEQAYDASCRPYDAATPEQRAILDAHPAPVFSDSDLAPPYRSLLGSLLRLNRAQGWRSLACCPYRRPGRTPGQHAARRRSRSRHGRSPIQVFLLHMRRAAGGEGGRPLAVARAPAGTVRPGHADRTGPARSTGRPPAVRQGRALSRHQGQPPGSAGAGRRVRGAGTGARRRWCPRRGPRRSGRHRWPGR